LVISLNIWLFSGQSYVFVDKLHCHYLTTNRFCPTFINQVSVVQLQARGPHVAHHNVFSGPRKHSGKSSNVKYVDKRMRLHLPHWMLALD